jgi:hypothetical protein
MIERENYSIAHNRLRIGESEVHFKWPITQVLPFNDVLVVRIEPDPGMCFNENVFGVGPGGTIAWTIGERRHVYEDSPYMYISAIGDNVLISNWDGEELLVDPASGAVLAVRQGK